MNAVSRRHPKVSIGLPVYNGERFLSVAIESLLGQTFRDFELIICDNASTDGTEALCHHFMRIDPRIRYYRNSKNLGATANFNRTFELADGEYFKWAADDDLCAPDFLKRCVRILEKDTSLVLCHSEVKFIDENGEFLKTYDYSMLPNIGSPEPHLRFADLIRTKHWCFDIFGLIRTNALRQTPLIASYAASDRTCLVALGLLGRFYRIPEYLFFSRDHSGRSIRKFPNPSYRTEWFDPNERGRISFPYWRIFFEYIKTLNRVSLPLEQRLACYSHLVKWLRKNYRRLKKDLRTGAKHTLIHVAGDILKLKKGSP